MTPPHSEPSTASSAPVFPVLTRAVLLSGLTLAIWSGAFNGAWVFDDGWNIVDNARIRRLWPLDDFRTNNRPLVLYSFALNYAAHGTSRFGYQAVNLAIHLTAGLLLFGLVRRTLRLPRFQERFSATLSTNLAAACGAVWLVHPLTTQAVTYVVQRYESAAAMFYVGLLYCLSRMPTASRPVVWAVMAIVASWCGFLSKETGATAPIAAVLYDRIFVADSWRATFRRWPFHLLLLSPLVWFVPRTMGFHVGAGSSMGFAMKSMSPPGVCRDAAGNPPALLEAIVLALASLLRLRLAGPVESLAHCRDRRCHRRVGHPVDVGASARQALGVRRVPVLSRAGPHFIDHADRGSRGRAPHVSPAHGGRRARCRRRMVAPQCPAATRGERHADIFRS